MNRTASILALAGVLFSGLSIGTIDPAKAATAKPYHAKPRMQVQIHRRNPIVGRIRTPGGDETKDSEPGYPTVGKAVQACGAGNVFVVYEEGGFNGHTNHRYDCAD